MQQESQSEFTALYFKNLQVYLKEEPLGFCFAKQCFHCVTMYNKYFDKKGNSFI